MITDATAVGIILFFCHVAGSQALDGTNYTIYMYPDTSCFIDELISKLLRR